MKDAGTSAGVLLRHWRERRHRSQLELAIEAGVSARHISFVETGRARPSADMLLRLSEQLDVPLRDRNQMLLAAGHAPAFEERALDSPAMAPIWPALQQILDAHAPYPAVIVDRLWNRVAGNHSIPVLTEGVAPYLLTPPINVIRVCLHPDGLAPRIINFGDWRSHLLRSLSRQISLTGDKELRALYDEVSGYPGKTQTEPSQDVAIPLQLRSQFGDLSFIATIATFGTALDITLAELAIEAFLPADAATREIVLNWKSR